MADDTPKFTRDPPTPTFTRDPPEAQPSWWGALGKSLWHGGGDLYFGGAQLGAHMGPEEGGAAFATSEQAQADLAARQATVDKVVKEREQTYRKDPDIKAYPKTAFVGDLAGEIAATAPFMALPGAAPTLPARMIGAGLAAIPIGAARPVADTSKGNYGTQKAGQIAGEVIGSAAGQAIGEKVIVPAVTAAGRGVRYLLQKPEQRVATKAAREAADQAVTKEKAAKKVTGKFAEAQKSGLVPGDVIKTMTEARAAGQPMTLMDVDPFPGSPIRRQVGNIYRGPGAAGRELEQFQEGRAYGLDPDTQRTWQGNRLYQLFMGMRDKLSSGSAKEAVETLAQRRSDAAKPLWDKAMEGGSVAPLEHQFTQEFDAATKAEAVAAQRLRQAQTKLVPVLAKQQTAGNVYASGAANKEARAVMTEAREAEQSFAQARQAKEEVRTRLQQAQADGTANAKGAVWSPALQRLLDNPRVRRGLNKGYEIERNNADAANRPFNAHEYAVVGQDENGAPIVGKVPNMRLIQMAKEGLDALLEDSDGKSGLRDPMTRRLTKEGQSIDGLRRSLLTEGDRLNPDWKAARQQWAGDSAELAALADGRHAFDRKADWTMEEFTKRWNEMEPGQRENFKLGAVDKLIEDLDFGRLGGDQTRAIINNPAARQKLRLMFGNDAEFNKAMKFITNERDMWETGTTIMRGAQTAERLATDEQEKAAAAQAVLHASHGLLHFAHGRVVAAGRSMQRAASHIGWGEDPSRLNLEIAKLYTKPDVQLRESPKGALQVGPPPSLPSVSALGATAKGTLGRLPSSMYYAWPRQPAKSQ
jgi:hypothetical protein